MRILRALARPLLFLAVAGVSPGLRAEEETGRWYFGASVGANYGRPADLDGFDTRVNYDLGLPRPRGVLGWRFADQWALEIEVAQRKTKSEAAYTPGTGEEFDPAANDRYTSAAVMLGITREFRIGRWLTPYVGLGVGNAWITYELSEGGLDGAEDVPLIGDDASALAWEATLGVKFPLSSRLDLGLEYEYWRTPGVNIRALDGSSVDLDQAVHSGWLTLFYTPGNRREAGFRAPRATGPAVRGWYLSGNAGVNWIRDAETLTVEFDAYSPGAVLTAAVGRTLGTHWRLEGEYAYRTNQAEKLDFGFRFGERRVKGSQRSSSLAVNVHYDFLPNAPIRPTFGVGAGVGNVRYRMRFVDDGSQWADDKASLGFIQTLLGVDVELTRALSFRTAWRMWVTGKHKVELNSGDVIEPEMWHHAVEFGLRYQLGR